MVKIYGESEIREIRTFGLKPLAASILGSPLVNPPIRMLARHLLPRRWAERLPLRKPVVKFNTMDGDSVQLQEPQRDLVARDIYWGGGRPTNPADDRVLRFVEKVCAGGGTFFDIGTYSGLFAILAAKCHPTLVAIAYEIVPENYVLTVRNVVVNDVVKRVTPKLLGLAEQVGSIKMPYRIGLGSNASSISIGSIFSEGVSIPVSTLDLEAEKISGPVIIKIDVEGFEPHVLRGGMKMIKDLSPDIVCEILHDSDAAAIAAVGSDLKDIGYRFFLSTNDGFVEKKNLVPDSAGRDWLLLKRPDSIIFVADI